MVILIDQPCGHCGNKQTEIIAAINVGSSNPAYNLYKCPACKQQQGIPRTPDEQQRTRISIEGGGFQGIALDEEIIAYNKEKEKKLD